MGILLAVVAEEEVKALGVGDVGGRGVVCGTWEGVCMQDMSLPALPTLHTCTQLKSFACCSILVIYVL